MFEYIRMQDTFKIKMAILYNLLRIFIAIYSRISIKFNEVV